MKTISMFIPCLADLFLPRIGEATVTLLRRLGLDPIYHDAQTCCGQPAISSGHMDSAVKAAKHFIQIFEHDEIIICPSGSCVHTVKHQYPDLLKKEPEWAHRARRVGAKTYELSQFLVDILGTKDVGASFSGSAVYHESCKNLRRLGISDQPRKLIDAVKNTELLPLKEADVCCGFGGEFSIRFPDISEAIVAQKVQHFINSEADILVLSEPGCLLNVDGYLQRHHPEKKAMHLAELLSHTE